MSAALSKTGDFRQYRSTRKHREDFQLALLEYAYFSLGDSFK
jgi:hypothetical protein